ncbi:uncharacterized protein LOC118449460 [Vespa mandarinia]|uniref:uncharacterized protein LOC118449460 n=1 Tax=Vespa mandarinia TaxID=7446 RepID=UPI001622E788|nr:uncharacterized protein LOC118449460 [Vespa mandarinia]
MREAKHQIRETDEHKNSHDLLRGRHFVVPYSRYLFTRRDIILHIARRTSRLYRDSRIQAGKTGHKKDFLRIFRADMNGHLQDGPPASLSPRLGNLFGYEKFSFFYG